ncbi:MAG: hypothetical protein SNJ70_11645 [Armatimonadota bacterium]
MNVILKKLDFKDIVEKVKIYYLVIDDKSPIEEFLDELNKSRIEDFFKITNQLKRIAQRGILFNEQQFRILKPYKPICKIKIQGVRLYCTNEHNIVILLNGDYKKSNKWSNQNKTIINKALLLYESYKSALNDGDIKYDN